MYFEVLQQHFRNAGGFGVVVALAGVQRALSRSMQRPETALQVSLFDRQKNKIELNDNGRMAVEYAGRIVGEARDMAARIQAFDRSRRTILVGSCAPAPLWEISQVLADLYPDRTIASEMRENQVLLEGLRDGVYQLIILPHPVEEAGITCAKYGEEHLFFSLPPAHPLSGSKALYMKALNGETMLLRNRLGFWREMAVRKMPDTRFLEQEDVAFNELMQFSAMPSFYNGRRAPAGGKPQKPHQHPDFGRRGKRDLLLPLPTGRRHRPAQLFPRDRRGFGCILKCEVIQRQKRTGAGKCFPAPVLLLP